MENLYQTNKDLQDYITRYRRNKDVAVEEVLSYKQTQLVAEYYREESKKYDESQIPELRVDRI